MTKICKRCNVEKKITGFKKVKYTEDGRSDVCRKCYDTNQLEIRFVSKETREKIGNRSRGKKYSLEHRLAISKGQRKAIQEGRHHWKKNPYRHKDQARHDIEYRIWREKLLERAGNKCEDCGSVKRLHAHHIKCFYKFPEMAFDENNGKILCQSCHSKLHMKLKKE